MKKTCKLCKEDVHGHGYCKKHYNQLRRRGNDANIVKTLCRINGCDVIVEGHGLCQKHYNRLRRHGEILKRTIYDPNEFITKDDICTIKLYNKSGEEIAEAIIDAEDYDKVKDYKFGYNVRDNTVFTHIDGRARNLSYIILNLKPGKGVYIDHINHNRLNNRKNNLRICSNAQNTQNRRKQSNNKTGLKGVFYNSKYIRASITVNGNVIHLGYFNSKEEAGRTYDKAALKYHGEFSCTNKMLGLL
jgi:hypothetical protein